jgi:hypothetical protein
MPYRGDAPPNATVTVTLRTNITNSGDAFLVATSAPFSGGGNGESTVVAPGATGSVHVVTPASGILKVDVDYKDDDVDAGQLDVTATGFHDGDVVQGDTDWTYSV